MQRGFLLSVWNCLIPHNDAKEYSRINALEIINKRAIQAVASEFFTDSAIPMHVQLVDKVSIGSG